MSHSVTNSEEMTRRARLGSLWVVTGYGASQVIRLASNLILTRLLLPDAFGLMALLSVFVLGIKMFSDLGIRPCVIRSQNATVQSFQDTAWTLQILRGLICWLLIFALSGPLANFYNQPQISIMLPVLSICILIDSFATLGEILANRKMYLGRIAGIEVASQAVGLVVAVCWTLITPTVWALVGYALTVSTVHLVLVYLLFPDVRHRLTWNKTHVHEIFNFGKWIFASSALTFVAAQIDRLWLGKLISMELLGIYSIAYMWAFTPLNGIIKWISNIFYPLVANSMQQGNQTSDELNRQKKKILILCAPIFIVAGALGDALIQLLYEENYWQAGSLLSLLALGAWFSLINNIYGQILLAMGNSRVMTSSMAVGTAVFLVLMYPAFYQFGIYGIALLLSVVFITQIAVQIQCMQGFRRGVATDIKLTLIFFLVAICTHLAHSHLSSYIGSTTALFFFLFSAGSIWIALLIGLFNVNPRKLFASG